MSRTVDLDFILDGTVTCNASTEITALLTMAGIKIKRTAKAIDYTILNTDYLIGADVSSQAITLTLPTASTVPDQIFEIVDEKGNSATNNITIAVQGGDTIIGESSLIINGNYNTVTVYSDGGTSYLVK